MRLGQLTKVNETVGEQGARKNHANNDLNGFRATSVRKVVRRVKVS